MSLFMQNKKTATSTCWSRWLWLPSLLFGDGLLFAVVLLSVVMLHRLGLAKVFTVLYVAWLCLPFVLRPLLEIVVSYLRGTTKVWILSAEFISALSLGALAFILPTGYWLYGTLCFLSFFVLAGMFGNIAIENFYIADNLSVSVREHRFFFLFRGLAMLLVVGVCVTMAGNMEVITRNIRYSWSFVVYVIAGIEFLLWLWHTFFLPGGKHILANVKNVRPLVWSELTLFLKNLLHNGTHLRVLLFLAVFVIPEAFLAFMSPLFMVDAAHNGGLGMSPQEFGLVFGTVGVVAFFVGNILAGYFSDRIPFSRFIILAAIVIPIHGLSMCCLSYTFDISLFMECIIVFLGYAASGFGLSVVPIVIRHYSIVDCSLLHRSVASGVVALIAVLSCSLSGFMQAEMGYRLFFCLILFMYAVPFIVVVVLLGLRKH